MNALGVDVTGLDVDAFLRTASGLWAPLAVVWLVLVRRLGRPAWLLAGAIAANAWVWGVTNYPLQQIYALSTGSDRLLQLGFVQVVAAGHSPLRTSQVGQLHFEPFWGLLVAALSGWSTERVLALYPFLPLAAVVAFAASLYFGLRAPPGAPGLSGWERALVAGFATLLSSAPLEYLGTYRVPWALTFLLKPNHALGLVLLPWLIWSFVRIGSWKERLATGLLLHLLGWVFVLHMVYASVGLVVFAALSLLERREGAGRDALDVATVIGVNVAVVSPYLFMLVTGYPFMVPSARMTIPVWSPHLLEATLQHAPVFLLGLWGAWTAHRRGDRLGRTISAMVLGALSIWLAYPILSVLQLAREKDEIYYWVRFLTAATAGLGAWDLAERAVAIALLALPWSLPSWWQPARMDAYFAGSLQPLPPGIAEAAERVRRDSEPCDVFAGDPELLRWVAALTGRRGLWVEAHVPPDWERRFAFLDRLIEGGDPEWILSEAQTWGVRYAAVSRRLLERHGVALGALAARPHLALVFEHRTPRDYFAIFRLQRGEE